MGGPGEEHDYHISQHEDCHHPNDRADVPEERRCHPCAAISKAFSLSVQLLSVDHGELLDFVKLHVLMAHRLRHGSGGLFQRRGELDNII